jgi:hypothetical protein
MFLELVSASPEGWTTEYSAFIHFQMSCNMHINANSSNSALELLIYNCIIVLPNQLHEKSQQVIQIFAKFEHKLNIAYKKDKLTSVVTQLVNMYL